MHEVQVVCVFGWGAGEGGEAGGGGGGGPHKKTAKKDKKPKFLTKTNGIC